MVAQLLMAVGRYNHALLFTTYCMCPIRGSKRQHVGVVCCAHGLSWPKIELLRLLVALLYLHLAMEGYGYKGTYYYEVNIRVLT